MIADARAAGVSPLKAYGLICRWQLIQLKAMLPFIVFAEVALGTGTAVGLGFLIPHIDVTAARYLASGAFLLNLLIIGIVIVPSSAAEAKNTGAFNYMWSLPVPRFTYLLADISVWFLVMVPSLLTSLVVTSLRFHFSIRPTLAIVPSVVLALITAASLGYAIALRSPSSQVTQLFTNVMLVAVLLFSPVNYPLSRLPAWLQAAHMVLPIAPIANLIRLGLVGFHDAHMLRDLVVITLWASFGLVVTFRAVSRRP